MSSSRPLPLKIAWLVPSVVLCTVALLNCRELGATETVYSGMTTNGLAEFARNQGWDAKVEPGEFPVVTIQVEGQSVRVELSDCDQQKRCMSGLIRDLTYFALKPDRHGFWHWNLKKLGATGFGPSYITLQRYLHFNGVTDRYLRDIIGGIWPAAARSFWDEVKQRYDAERRRQEAE
jgi:hypothetical protein